MKRSAAVQLTKEQQYEDEDMEDITPARGFKKADESILASRPIKGLPKRGNTVAATFDAAESQNEMDQTSSVPTSSFTFNTPAPTIASSSTQPPASNPSFTFSSPFVSSSATSAAKRLSSFISSASQSNGSLAAAPGAKSAAEAAEARYFRALRGLNEAIKAEVGKRLDSDPFADLAGLLEEYTEFRSDIQKEYDESQKPRGTSLTNGTSSTSPFNADSSSGTPQTSAKPSLPVPPKSFAGFGAPSSSSSIPLGGGFRPNFGAASSVSPSPFSLGSSSTSDKTPSTSSPFAAPSASSSAEKPSPFSVSGASTKQSTFGDSSSSPFTLGSQTSNKSSAPSGSGSVFGSASSSTASDPPAATRTTIPNFFGSSSMNNFTSAPSFGGAGSSSSGLSFGSAKTSTVNPVGFSFANDSPTPGADAVKHAAASSSGSFFPLVAPKTTTSFGSLSSVPSTSSSGNSAASTAANQDAAESSTKTSAPASVASSVESRSNTPFSTNGGDAPVQDVSTPKQLGENPNDLEGEGEEDEETVHTTRVKVYRFGTAGDQPHWSEVGVGMVRIKKHKETGSLRLLSRNSGNGKIMMNFKLYSGIKTTRAKQVLNFVGHENGVNVTFRVRVKDEAGAIALQEAIEKAVSSL